MNERERFAHLQVRDDWKTEENSNPLNYFITDFRVLSLGSQKTDEAYVTLLYGDEFLLGVRVLGKSIRDTGSKRDMVVLVSDYAKLLLQADGWIVEKISLLANPNQIRPKRFWGVYTKLKIFNMTDYKRGDQGFLNSYFAGFPNAHMLADKWMVNESELHVIHYTLGPLKPWDWWTSWLLKPVDVWQNVREQLEESLPGTGGGRNPNDDFLVKFLFLLPVCALVFCCYRSFLQSPGYFSSFCRSSLCEHVRHLYYMIRSGGPLAYTSVSPSTINLTHQCKVPAYLGGISVIVCFVTAVVSLGLALLMVPRQVMPWTDQGITSSSSLSGPESSDYDSGKGHQRKVSSCDVALWYYGLGMAFLAIAAPSLPCVFRVTALFLRLGLMVAGGIILAAFMTYASEHLAIRSFLKGFEDHDISRSRIFCFIC
ncbi:hypothetical protein L6164_010596 [Bauhinia variegata]|uniref:Uncharacterized protein n=1 Tax=Bauhinia variegata TaxID=167791 RepID=A0ACB9PQJ4_BAUVA|nr:hypothetical protein L6164_010596 [Bauhinia variegata]